MPVRKVPLVDGQVYHVFNRGIDKRPTYLTKAQYQREITAIAYYRHGGHTLSLSEFLKRGVDERQKYFATLAQAPRQQVVTILAYCLMPNHFHLLLQQNSSDGISHFLQLIQSSYTQYFNKVECRHGPLFNTQFKAVHVDSGDQLQYVSRYIHLNPFTGYVCKSLEDVLAYPWSSLSFYARPEIHNSSIDTAPILSEWADPSEYIDYVLNFAEYQRKQHNFAHLHLEDME